MDMATVLLDKQSQLRPNDIALVDDTAGRELTYAELASRASALARGLRQGLGLEAGDRVALESLINDYPGRYLMPERGLGDTWYVLYTSGTTGKPKGVIQTFGMAVFNHLNIGVPMDITSRDRTLNVLPFFHTGGINLLAMPTLIAGGKVVKPNLREQYIQ